MVRKKEKEPAKEEPPEMQLEPYVTPEDPKEPEEVPVTHLGALGPNNKMIILQRNI